MRTIISGRVRPEHLADAEFLIGIVPTSYVTNGHSTPPAGPLPVNAYPPCPMLPAELAERQRNYTLCNSADALVWADGDDHLLRLARQYELLVYEA